MIVFLLALLLLSLFGTKYKKDTNGRDSSFLNIKQTSAICGVFVVIIFLNHFFRHIDFSPWYDKIAVSIIDTFIGQLMVVPFFLFSGFGVTEQYKKKGNAYLKNFPLQRILKVYIIYLICMVIEVVANWMIGGFVNFSFDPLILTMWQSYWFVFVIICLYVLSLVSFTIFKKKHFVLFLCSVLSICFAILLCVLGKESNWYNTIIAFPIGVGLSLYIDNFKAFLSKNKKNPIILLAISLILWLGTFFVLWKFGLFTKQYYAFLYYFEVIGFIGTLLIFLYYFSFGNKILLTLGKYTIWSYLLQNISFKLFSTSLNVLNINKYLYLLCCLVFTAILVFVIKLLFNLFDKYCYKKLMFKK